MTVLAFDQMLGNILINSIDAFNGAKISKPTITINLLANKKNDLLITIHDNGPGMSAKLQEDIFKPFFTTKGDSGGTGIGLTIVYSVVNEFKGKINIKSDEGKGTTTTIQIPNPK